MDMTAACVCESALSPTAGEVHGNVSLWHPHIFGSLQGYPGKWARSLPGGMNISLNDLLRCMDCTFRNVHDYDSMIQSLYKIHQREHETAEEYMLRVHEAVAVVKRAYPDQVPNEGEGLRRDRFYYGLTPSLRDALSFAMADLLERNKQIQASTPSTIWPRNFKHDTTLAAPPREDLQLTIPIMVTRSIPPL